MFRWIFILLGFSVATKIYFVKTETARVLDLSAHWKPLTSQKLHAPVGSSSFISLSNLEATNKLQLAQIAHHNAQIYRHIKGYNPPVTHYRNPFTVYQKPALVNQQAYGNVVRNVPQNILASSSNIAQNVLPNSFIKQTFISAKPTYLGKHEFSSQPHFFNGIHTSTSKIPTIIKSYSITKQPVMQYAHDPSSFRDITLTPPPPPQPVYTKPHSVPPFVAFPTAQQQLPYDNFKTFHNFKFAPQPISSYSFYGPAPHLVNKQPKYPSSLLNLPVESHVNFKGTTGSVINSNIYNGKLNSNVQENYNQNNQIKPSFKFPSNDGFEPSLNFNKESQKDTFIPSHEHKEEQYLPPVPASVLSPFFQQIHQQQYNTNEDQNQNNKNKIQDEFSKNLVPPLFYHLESSTFRSTAAPPTPSISTFEQQKVVEILNKYNIPAISPLQDTSKFNYDSDLSNYYSSTPAPAISSSQSTPLQNSNYFNFNQGSFQHFPTTPTTPILSSTTSLYPEGNQFDHNQILYHHFQTTPSSIFSTTPLPHDDYKNIGTFITTEKPNIFKNLKRPSESIYKEHKLMHPNYTGAKYPNDVRSSNKNAFLPTPNDAENNLNTPEHSFFTIEDAITLPPSMIPSSPIVPTEMEKNENFQKTIIPTKSVISNHPTKIIISMPNPTISVNQQIHNNTEMMPIRVRPRNKMRRRRPKPSTENEMKMNEVRTASTVNRTTGRYRITEQPITTEQNYMDIRSNRLRRPQKLNPSSTSASYQITSRNPQRNKQPMKVTTQNIPDASGDGAKVINYFSISDTEEPIVNESPSVPAETVLPTKLTTLGTDNTITTQLFMEPNLPTISYSQNNIPTLPTIQITNVQSDLISTTSPVHDQFHIRPNNILPTNILSSVEPTTTTGKPTELKDFSIPPSEKIEKDAQRKRIRHRQRFRSNNRTSASAIQRYTKPTIIENDSGEKMQPIEDIQESTEIKTTEVTTERITRLKPINKYEAKSRPRFSIKEYRQQPRSTTTATSTTESSKITNRNSSTSLNNRVRFPTRKRLLPNLRSSTTSTTSTTTTTPKPLEGIESRLSEKDIIQNHIIETNIDVSSSESNPVGAFKSVRKFESRSSIEEASTTSTTPKPRSTRRGGTRRTRFTSSTSTTTEASSLPAPIIRNSSNILRRPQTLSLKVRIKNSQKNENEKTDDFKESQDNVEDLINIALEPKNETLSSTETVKIESGIMKIAKDDHSYRPQLQGSSKSEQDFEENTDLNSSPSEHSQRVAQLTISGGVHNNFNVMNQGILSRRIPGYFTLATEDPILPIEAFFPNVRNEKLTTR